MITPDQLKIIFRIFKQVNPNLRGNEQLYNPNEKCRINYLVKLEKDRKIIAAWTDFDLVNEWKLRILFKRHKEVPHQFFIKQVDNFYRIGWKAI
ncbi:hypothetical protein [Flavobacterium sp. J27]|uniref:hypothetical protein n=1 Tax=Flavobacterium sp. J27 TaxID=2060419 RepID=UPI0010307B82|nr:hypothetical protein [Flavobacterium sp. J27]